MTERERHRLWELLANHFLDTETRHTTPETAHQLIKASCSVDEAREMWRYDVTPVVGHNLWSVAGEWAGWDTKSLITTIESHRKSWLRRVNVFADFRYRLLIGGTDLRWAAIERCMRLLEAEPVTARRALADDLTWLGCAYFDMTSSLHSPSPADRARLKTRFTQDFIPIFGPLVTEGPRESRASCAERVERLFASWP